VHARQGFYTSHGEMAFSYCRSTQSAASRPDARRP